jgi:hypothetical protein
VLGNLEIKKLLMFPGSCLEEHKESVGFCHSYAEMLASPSASEDDGWLRLCHRRVGETECMTAEARCS